MSGDLEQTKDVFAGFPDGAEPSDVVSELAAAVFSASLRRRDQRAKGEQYLRGLLTVGGRKTMRNIASLVGGSAAEQSLQHFISSSTWDWAPVREALACYVQRTVPPQAWVLQQMSIPKAGDQSVGVTAGPPASGEAPGQRAFGLWFASEEMSVPVNWRLHLPECWLQDSPRRRRADIPAETVAESPDECAVATVLETMNRWPVPRRPLLLNACGHDLPMLMREFGDSGVPVLARIGPSSRLAVADPALPGYGAGAVSAQQIVEAVKGLRHAVRRDGSGALVVAVPVAFAQRAPFARGVVPGRGQRSLLLLGVWNDPLRPAGELLLTDMTQAPVPALLRMSRLARRVSRDFTEVGERVGLRDFEGRSFRGWHRHITLASVAHAAALLGGTGWGDNVLRAPFPVAAHTPVTMPHQVRSRDRLHSTGPTLVPSVSPVPGQVRTVRPGRVPSPYVAGASA
ncbi:transposase [Streptomyces sp. NPDC006175]|uniref:IS701 family transposase n=1 Tax=unclassified Streptomyces TaxID=2593676 RepID=UPI0033AA0B1F